MAKPDKPSDVDPKDLEGRKAPDVTLTAVGPSAGSGRGGSPDRKKVKLSDFAGKKNVVLYFYPKDDTPGCTKEACGFRDLSREFARTNTVILGVSCDDEQSHENFSQKYQLPFPLLSDPDAKAAMKFGVWKEKTRFGKTSPGVNRTTFVIDKSGKVAKVYKTVKTDIHHEQVLEYVKESLT